MKLGISIKIDVSKIDKDRLFKGEKGTYMDLTTFIDTENKDSYGNNGFISQSVDRDEREAGVKTPILGNTKVFYTGDSVTKGDYDKGIAQAKQAVEPAPAPAFEDDIPF